MIQKAVATPKLKMVLGTDAVAGAHGHNADEIVERVRQGGQKPMDAIISATSLAAKSMRLDKTIGTLAAGYEADIVGLDGDPTHRHHRGDARRVRDEGRQGLQVQRRNRARDGVNALTGSRLYGRARRSTALISRRPPSRSSYQLTRRVAYMRSASIANRPIDPARSA